MASPLTDRLVTLVTAAGYGAHEPVIVGVQRGGGEPVFVTRGHTRDGAALTGDTVAYAASLSKQMAAAAAALLVRDGRLDIDDPVAAWLPELPAWAAKVRLRHLVHHTGAIPDRRIAPRLRGRDRTTREVLAALAEVPDLDGPPGAAYAYSNAGYVCLAEAVARAAGQPLAAIAEERLFSPLGLRATGFWAGPEPVPPGAARLAFPHPAPHAVGAGGAWSTARDLLRWCAALSADTLGLAEVIDRPGRLDDGTPIHYAWGQAVREHTGHRMFRHGGGWPSLRALLARVPDLAAAVVILALDDYSDRREALGAGLLDVVTTASAGVDQSSP
jgi:CubicO group peptidase (beta-lactamase class C family)